MRGTVAKRLRHMAKGNRKVYRKLKKQYVRKELNERKIRKEKNENN